MRTLLLAISLTLLAAALAPAGAVAAEPLKKGISMNGPQPLRADGHPNDYRHWGNPGFFTESGTDWVKLWVSWADLQQEYAATSLADSWRHLNSAPGGQGYLRRLDAQIRAANDDGRKVMVTIYQAFPTWANGATGPDPLSTRPAGQKLPTDLSPDGPWGWFVGHLSARYDGSYNATGPHQPAENEGGGAWRGNPSNARIDALEVVNEPNLLYWPNENLPANVATMIRSGEELSYRWGRQAIIGPATSDHPDPGAERTGVTSDWRSFTAAVVRELAGFAPRVPVWWSHHNYKDVKYGALDGSMRVQQVIDMLGAGGWKGGADRQVWITEAGLNMGSKWADAATRETQARSIETNFEAMKAVPEVAVWMQHSIHDIAGNSFRSSLRDDFDHSVPGPGAARPAHATWQRLSGARPLQSPPTEVVVAPEPEPQPEEPPAQSTPPAEEPPALEAPAQEAPAQEAPAAEGAAAEEPAQAQDAPAESQQLVTEGAPAQDAPAQQQVAQDPAAQDAPAQPQESGDPAAATEGQPSARVESQPAETSGETVADTPQDSGAAAKADAPTAPVAIALVNPLRAFVVGRARLDRLHRGLPTVYDVREAGRIEVVLLAPDRTRLARAGRAIARRSAGRVILRFTRRALRRAERLRGRTVVVRATFTPASGEPAGRVTRRARLR